MSLIARASIVLTDVTANLQDAVDNMHAGDILMLGRGTFTAPSGGLVIDKSIEIAGCGQEYGTIIQPYSVASGQPVIVVKSDTALTGSTELNGIYIHDLQINGGAVNPDHASAVLSGCYGISIQTHASGQLVRNVALERVTVKRCSNHGLYVTGDGGARAVIGLKMSACSFVENWGDGRFVQGATLVHSTLVLCAANYGRGSRFESCSPTIVTDYYEDNCHDSSLLSGYDGQLSCYAGVVNISGVTFEDFTKVTGSTYRQQVGTQTGLALQWVSGKAGACKFYNAEQSAAPDGFGVHIDNTEGKAAFLLEPCMFDNCYIAVACTTGQNIKQTIMPQNAHSGDSLILGAYGTALLAIPTSAIGTPDALDVGQMLYDSTTNTMKFWDGSAWKVVATV